MVIFRNGRVIGVDRAFLKSINERLDTLSYALNIIELQIASLRKESIELKGQKFQVKQREILSVEEDIAIFELVPEKVEGEQKERKIVPIIRGEKVPFGVKRGRQVETPSLKGEKESEEGPSTISTLVGKGRIEIPELPEELEIPTLKGGEQPQGEPKGESKKGSMEIELPPLEKEPKAEKVEELLSPTPEKREGEKEEEGIEELLEGLEELDLEPIIEEKGKKVSKIEEVEEKKGEKEKGGEEKEEELSIPLNDLIEDLEPISAPSAPKEEKEEELVPPPLPEEAKKETPLPKSSKEEKKEEELLDLDDLLGDLEPILPEEKRPEVKEEKGEVESPKPVETPKSGEKGTKKGEEDFSLEDILPVEEEPKKGEPQLEEDLLSFVEDEVKGKIEEPQLGDSLDALLEEEERKGELTPPPAEKEKPEEKSVSKEEEKKEKKPAPQEKGGENLLENLELVEEEGKKEEKPQGPIILQFEDDFEEVRELLREDTERARQKVKEELQKASLELGIPEDLGADLFKDLINQIMGEKKYFRRILKAGDYDELHKTAHKLKGAALNLRLSQIALILKMIDEYSKRREPIDTIANLVDSFYQFMEKVKDVDKIIGKEEIGRGVGGSAPSSSFSSPTTGEGGEREASTPPSPKPKLTRIIIKTIRKYLERGDEKAFQRDKKHIEKLLNTKLSSLDDLRKFIGE
jgi:HPt (histidine-containing phosphotransfer) domain-containing protein